ncbi:sensor histidine kinase [Streptomyces sp. 8N706]|uniref:sensor histidine kinase n=1 Tax=Streptomyces sp. 8N706 TaxID=3457416 RepID=UPI003FD60E58
MTTDQDSTPQRAKTPPAGPELRFSSTFRTLARDLFSFAPRPMPYLSRTRNRVLRRLPLISAVLFALLLTGSNTALILERLRAPGALCLALAAGQTLPIPLALVRPMAAWWLSLPPVLAYAVLTASEYGRLAPGDPWPWTEPGLMAHVTVTLIVGWRVRAPAFVGLWVIGVLAGSLLEALLRPEAAASNLALFATLSAVGLVIEGALRGRRDAQRKLKRQENLTEIERSRRTLLEERTRIARELHDVVAHYMSVVAVQAEAAPYRVPDPPQELSDSFAGIRENALAALTELRHILGMLRSDEQGSDGRYAPQPTLTNIDELVANVRAAGLRIDTVVSGTPRPLPQGVALSAFRIVQEALSNVLRHAPGSQVEVGISYGHADIGLRVVNSPATGPVRRQAGSGHGVLGMRERAATLGGTLRVGLREDGWYEVTASLPTGESEGS